MPSLFGLSAESRCIPSKKATIRRPYLTRKTKKQKNEVVHQYEHTRTVTNDSRQEERLDIHRNKQENGSFYLHGEFNKDDNKRKQEVRIGSNDLRPAHVPAIYARLTFTRDIHLSYQFMPAVMTLYLTVVVLSYRVMRSLFLSESHGFNATVVA